MNTLSLKLSFYLRIDVQLGLLALLVELIKGPLYLGHTIPHKQCRGPVSLTASKCVVWAVFAHVVDIEPLLGLPPVG